MIKIKKSATADTRTCDFSKVTSDTLLASSVQHIQDVERGIDFIRGKLDEAGLLHDLDKLVSVDKFHEDFLTGFAKHEWWDNHRKISRHHLQVADGVPEDVNLMDVLEMITDCVMAGMARSGNVYPLNVSPELLKKAFDNTVELLKSEVVVEE